MERLAKIFIGLSTLVLPLVAQAAVAAQDMTSGQNIFRFDTFGSEVFWGEVLKLHKGVEKISPKQALDAGLKVDVDALPADLQNALKQGKLDLNDPANTAALLKLKAVIGVDAQFGKDGKMKTIGITCASCHSTVDDSFATGIGKRLDGWPNRDLNVGAIVSLSPDLSPVAKLLRVDEKTVRKVLAGWGPGRYDAILLMDGKGFRPDGKTAATLLPAAYGLAGVSLATYTGWGNVNYWNAYVANTQMHGQGTFFDNRLNDERRFPVAARNHMGNIRPRGADMISPKLAALHQYQLSLAAPTPPKDSFDERLAARGRDIFNGKAKCATCHVPPNFTEPGRPLHSGAEIGIDDFHANRSPTGKYRTTPLKGVWARSKGGYYHDGRFADLRAVVEHYDDHMRLNLSHHEISEVVEYLKSL